MRRYSNNAVQTTLSAAATAVQNTLQVSATTGFPGVDFVLAIDYGSVNQELVLVTGVAGNTLTVTRGYDNTTAVSHDVGAVVTHTHSAADFADSRNHEAATSDVHGVTGDLVGTTEVQVLSNKDLTDPTNTFPGSLATDAELSAHAGTKTGVHGVTGNIVGTTDTQTLTNKTLDATCVLKIAYNNSVPLSDANGNLVDSAVAPNGEFVGTTDTQTLTNKDLSSSTNKMPGNAGKDSGYVNLTLASGWTAVSGETPQIRRIGHTVYIDGRCTGNASWTTGSHLIANLPTGYTPTKSVYVRSTQGGTDAEARIYAKVDGTLTADNMGLPQNELSLHMVYLTDDAWPA